MIDDIYEMAGVPDHGHKHCNKHCVRTGHGWGQCEGRRGERWHLKCPRCDERKSILAELMDEYDPYEDVAVSAVLRIVRGDA